MPTIGTILIRKHPKHGNDVIFRVNRGQLICDGYCGCDVSVRFDDKKSVSVHANTPSDRSSDTLFLRGYEKLLKGMKSSKRMLIEATFYKQGLVTFEFDVSNLKFE